MRPRIVHPKVRNKIDRVQGERIERRDARRVIVDEPHRLLIVRFTLAGLFSGIVSGIPASHFTLPLPLSLSLSLSLFLSLVDP